MRREAIPPCRMCGGRRFSLKSAPRRRKRLQRYCLDCHASRARAWREQHPGAHQAAALASRRRHLEEVRRRDREAKRAARARRRGAAAIAA